VQASRLSAIGFVCSLLVLFSSGAGAAPKSYVFSGKLTSNRGTLINLPMVGNVGCNGAGFANLTVMSGPGGKAIPSPYTPAVHSKAHLANNYGCVAHVPGKKVTTTGAGAGGAFVMPAKAFSRPAAGYSIHIPNATPIRQLFTSFAATGPRAPGSVTGAPGSMFNGMNAAAFHGFKKGAWATQTGRAASMFTWCWGNPNCAKITQGTKPLIVKYAGGGSAFGGTMGFVISSGPNPSNIAVAVPPGGPIGFGILATHSSQPTGRGYAVKKSTSGTPGPVWGMYMASSMGKITMVSLYLGMYFPAAKVTNYGFPFTTMTVLARNTGTVAGNPKITTLTAKGGDTVTAMGRRNINLVAGGVARSNTLSSTPVANNTANVPEIAQMYLPEPGNTVSLLAGALGLLAIAASRRTR
jgi:hypothetical protein